MFHDNYITTYGTTVQEKLKLIDIESNVILIRYY